MEEGGEGEEEGLGFANESFVYQDCIVHQVMDCQKLWHQSVLVGGSQSVEIEGEL